MRKCRFCAMLIFCGYLCHVYLCVCVCVCIYMYNGENCCLLVLDSVASTPQCTRQPRPRVYLTRLFRGPSTPADMKKEDGPSPSFDSWPTMLDSPANRAS